MPKKNPAEKPAGSAKPNKPSQASASNRSGPANIPPDEPQTQLSGDEALSTTQETKDNQLLFPKKDETGLLPVGHSLDAFRVIERSPDQTGYLNGWTGDLVGRRLSVTDVLVVSGWAIDEVAGLPATEVLVVRRGKIIARSPINLSRPDVAEAKSLGAYTNAGWNISVSGKDLGVGDHELEVYALMQGHSSVVRLASKTVSVCPLCQADPSKQVVFDKIIAKRLLRECSTQGQKWPKMNVDDVSIQDGQLRIRGWALSPVGISRVKVYVDGKFVGLCFYGSPRPDVRRFYPFVQDSERSGFMLTKSLDSGDFRNPMLLNIIVVDRNTSVNVFTKSFNPNPDSLVSAENS